MIKQLLNILPQTGTIQWIGLRPGKGQDIVETEVVNANTQTGLEGDRYNGNRRRLIMKDERQKTEDTR